MNIKRLLLSSVLVLALGCVCLWPVSHARAGGGGAGGGGPVPVPAVVQNGFNAWAKNRNASWAFDVWKMGGLMEQDKKPVTLSRYFFQMDQILGNYQTYEVVDTKRIGQNSAVLYVSVNFAHAVMFGRFMVYRTDKDWVVQNMDFSARPEAIMPWLAFEGESYTQ